MNRGQATQETIVAVIIVLIILVLVFGQFRARENLNTALVEASFENTECEKISTMISLVNFSEGSDSISFPVSNDFNIIGNEVLVGNTFCPFFGVAADAELSAGDIRIYDFNGVATVENL